MDKDECRRLKQLQKEAGKSVSASSLETLTLPNLFRLLREEQSLRDLIRDIVAAPDSRIESEEGETSDKLSDNSAAEYGAPGTPPPAVRATPPPIDTLRQQLAPELALLQAVRKDAELAAEWMGTEVEEEGRQLLQLVACASQWDLLSQLWEKLAERCKREQRAATSAELHILGSALALHNLRWQGRQAQLAEVAAGAAYDYELHQRGTATGDNVRALWLPGLVNAGGQLHKKPLVQT